MNLDPKKLLIVDDEANMRHMLTAMLARHGYTVELAPNGMDGLKALEASGCPTVLCDLRMPRMDGLAFLAEAKKVCPEITVIMMSAYGTIEDAVKAMKLGAYDYIAKPFKEDEILQVLAKVEERNQLLEENRQLRLQVAGEGAGTGFGRMIGKSAAMQQLFELAAKVAPYSTTVLVTGESGTGKELVARGLHQASPRKSRPFVAVNCGSIPENLLESELFGYVRGAFTGAEQDKPGLFEAADQGTLFLDEIAELPLAMQVKLLRVLQEQEIRRVGGTATRPVDVRIVAATARDLGEMVENKQFRGDLFYRLNIVQIQVPPLRERRDDLSLLCHHFLAKMNRQLGRQVRAFSPRTMEQLLKHEWPGNVRELENVIERAVILAEDELIVPENLPDYFGTASQQRRINDFFGTFSLKKAKLIMEEKMISRAMEAAGGNKSKAARMLEISYPALLSKLKEYGC
ncbi:sigma-54-dependent transcriptional regulator [Desulfogranum mediterraneum]|uniref:sigma-54-dependent transcriptional regulator n=1 Tax=Desulfogranum mediterraneum TaxID=160661 RepID=UPI0004052423|nr:sigma-54 dependent transcriptional regulator [Desulfogranum mediterraneum]